MIVVLGAAVMMNMAETVILIIAGVLLALMFAIYAYLMGGRDR